MTTAITSAVATAGLDRRRKAGQASSLFQVLLWAARHRLQWQRLLGERDEAEGQRRDIARVRKLADQVRRSHPGYADDLSAAAATLEAQMAAR